MNDQTRFAATSTEATRSIRVVEYLQSTAERLYQAPGSVLALVALGLGLLKYGIGLWSGWRNLHLVAVNWSDPHVAPELSGIQDYFLPNAGFSALLGLLGVEDRVVWLAIHVAVACVAVMSPLLMTAIRGNPPARRLVFLLIVGGPILPVLLTWMGNYDALLVVGLVVGATARSLPVAAVGWLLVGLGHGQLGFLAALAWVAVRLTSNEVGRWREQVPRFGVALVANAAGYVVMSIVVDAWGGSTSRLYLNFEHDGLVLHLQSFLTSMPFLLFSALGVGWLLLLRADVLRLRASRMLLVVVVLSVFLLPLVGVDHTRVVFLVMLPAVLAWAVEVANYLGDDGVQGLWRTFLPAAVVVPVPMMVNGYLFNGGWWSYVAFRGTVL